MFHANDETLRQMTPEALIALGAPTLAYVREIAAPSGAVFGIFSADGNQIGVAPTREIAFVAARQHDLEPVSVH